MRRKLEEMKEVRRVGGLDPGEVRRVKECMVTIVAFPHLEKGALMYNV